MQSAYETLYALLETAFSRLNVSDLSDCFDRIVAGISDEHDIRILCNLMLTKLVILAPDETRMRLEAIAENFRAVLSTKAKENAVKQEIEKIQEGSKGVLKVSVLLNKRFSADSAGIEDSQLRGWQNYWEWVRKDFPVMVKAAEDDLKEKDR